MKKGYRKKEEASLQEPKEGSMTVAKKELSKTLSEKPSFPVVDRSAKLMDEVFEIMQGGMERGEKIKIPGFGNFRMRQKRARIGRNPKIGERIQISYRRGVTYKPRIVLRKSLNKGGQ